MWVEILYGGKYWKPLWIAFIIDCVDVILRATQDKHYHFTEHIVWGRLLEKVLGNVLNITNRVIGRLLTTLTTFSFTFNSSSKLCLLSGPHISSRTTRKFFFFLKIRSFFKIENLTVSWYFNILWHTLEHFFANASHYIIPWVDSLLKAAVLRFRGF